jgi:hypothetical protein
MASLDALLALLDLLGGDNAGAHLLHGEVVGALLCKLSAHGVDKSPVAVVVQQPQQQ